MVSKELIVVSEYLHPTLYLDNPIIKYVLSR